MFNTIETAEEFCNRINEEEGESWSADYIALAEKMEEYAKYYHTEMTKNNDYLIGCDTAKFNGHDDSIFTLGIIHNNNVEILGHSISKDDLEKQIK